MTFVDIDGVFSLCGICGNCTVQGHVDDYSNTCTQTWCDHCGLTYVAAYHTWFTDKNATCCCERAVHTTWADVPLILCDLGHDVTKVQAEYGEHPPDAHEKCVVVVYWCLRLSVILRREQALQLLAEPEFPDGDRSEDLYEFWDTFHSMDKSMLPALPAPVLGFQKGDVTEGFVGVCCNCGHEHQDYMGAD